jgi:hypothetical protein
MRRGRRWRHFQVEQVSHTAFTPITWAINQAMRRVDVPADGEPLRVTVDAASHGLAGPGVLTLRLTTAGRDGGPRARHGPHGRAVGRAARRRPDERACGLGPRTASRSRKRTGALHVWTLTFP